MNINGRIVGLAVIAALAGPAGSAAAALVDTPNAVCRRHIAAGTLKLSAAVTKAYDDCIRYTLFDDALECSTLALADIKDKIPTAVTKLPAAIDNYCSDTTTSVARAEHARCGVPIGTPITSFADLAACLPPLVTANLESLYARVLRPDFPLFSDNTYRCIHALSKSIGKLSKAVQKVKYNATRAADDLGEDSTYVDPGDPYFRIALAKTKAAASITKACAPLAPADWAAVGSCAGDLDGVIDCVLADVEAVAGGLIASSYSEPGICPSELRVAFRGGAQGGAIVGATAIDYGHAGLLHNGDFTDGAALRLDLDCGAPTDNSCSLCTLASNCEGDTCRCAHDNSLVCDEPFGTDVDDCAGNDCEMFFGPPLPLSGGGTPFCVVNNIGQAIAGQSDLAAGEMSLALDLQTSIYLGAAQDRQCPYCEAGSCNGGERDGLPCDVDATSDFGDVSYDCPPNDSALLTPGAGLAQTVALDTGNSSLGFALPCDPPLAVLDCACSACTGDLGIACNSDSDCSTVGAGTCMTSGAHGGAFRLPNPCADGMCQFAGAGEGRCSGAGPFDSYCDGYLKGNGEGVVSCTDDNDCSPMAVGFDAGQCTLLEARPCFRDPVTASGVPALGHPTLAGAYCVPPVAGFAVGALGFPGPARMTLATHVTSLCSDGLTPWGTGGANCP